MKPLTLLFSLLIFADYHSFSVHLHPITPTDSLTFQNVKSKKGKYWSISRGSQIKAKIKGQNAKKGFIHAVSKDSLILVTQKGLLSVSLTSAKQLIVRRSFSQQMISGKLISHGALLAIPAGLGLGLAIRETLVKGPFIRKFYVGALTFGIPAASLIISGVILRNKKLKFRKWKVVS